MANSPIPLGGYVSGGGGTFPILGYHSVEITGNANLTLSLTQADPCGIRVLSDGSSTGLRKVVFPTIAGKQWRVENAVTENLPIQCVMATGTGVIIPPGATFDLVSDGVNIDYVSVNPAQLAVTYQPGGTPGGTVFTTWTVATAYVTALIAAGFEGQVTYILDDSYGSVVLSGAIPGASIQFQSISAGRSVSATLSAGITFPNFTGVVSTLSVLNISFTSTGGTFVTFNGHSHFLELSLNASSIVNNGSAATIAGENGATLIVDLNNFAELRSGSGNFPVIAIDANDTLVSATLQNGSELVTGISGSHVDTITVEAFGGCTITGGSSSAAYQISATADCTITAPGAAISYLSLASQTSYTPASSSNWETIAGSVPAVDSAALDDLAEYVVTLPTVTWADDLGTSTNTGQWVEAISGPSGTAGTVNVGDGVHPIAFASRQVPTGNPGQVGPSVSWTTPTGFITGAHGFGAGGFFFQTGNGGASALLNTGGGNGGGYTVTLGNGGGSNGTAANSSGGSWTCTTGAAGTGGSGGAGSVGVFQVSIAGAATKSLALTASSSDILALGAPASGSGTTTALSGLVRFPASPGVPLVSTRNGAGTGDVGIVGSSTSGSDQTVTFGSSGVFETEILGGTEVAIDVDASLTAFFTATNSDFVALGGPNNTGDSGTTAQSGLIRFPASPGVPLLSARNEANTGDNALLGVSTSGPDQTFVVGDGNLFETEVAAGTQFVVNVAASVAAFFTATTSDFLAIGGPNNSGDSGTTAQSGTFRVPAVFEFNARDPSGSSDDVGVISGSTANRGVLSFGDPNWATTQLFGASVVQFCQNATISTSNGYSWTWDQPSASGTGQNGSRTEYAFFASSSGTGSATLATVEINSGFTARATVVGTARATAAPTSGAVGDSATLSEVFLIKNIAGAITFVGSQVVDTIHDTHAVFSSFNASQSGDVVSFSNIPNAAGGTFLWQGTVTLELV